MPWIAQEPKKPHKGEQKLPDSELLRQANQIAAAIFSLRPWDQFPPERLFVQFSKDGQHMTVARTADPGECRTGIVLIPDTPALTRALTPVEEEPADSDLRRWIESEYYAVYFVCAEDCPEDVHALLGDAAGDSLLPWFGYKRSGFPLRPIEEKDLPVLTELLGGLMMQYRCLLENRVQVDPEKGELLFRAYDEKTGLWQNFSYAVALPAPPLTMYSIREDAPRLSELRACPPNADKMRVEFDIGWLPDAVCDEDGSELYYNQLVLFADRTTGKALSFYNCRPDNLLDAAFTAFSDLIHEHGRPETLYYSRPEAAALMQGFAGQLGIKVKKVKHLTAVQRLFRANGVI